MKYPSKAKVDYKKNIDYSNRGMSLEFLINETNAYYDINDIAIIYKKPTPVTIGKVKYDTNKKIITKGYFKSKSSLDYVGLYQGRYIDFDAKSTKNKTSFPLSNLHKHQLNHIKKVIKHGGISFLIIEMNNNIYLLDGYAIITFIENNNRKSIPYDFIKNNGFLIEIRYNPYIDYIKIIDKYLLGGINDKKIEK